MIDTDTLDAVIQRTGADYEKAKAALKISDGDIEMAVRIIQTYNLKDDAANSGSFHAGAEKDQAKPDGRENQTKTEEQIPLAGDILDAIKDIWKKGNASRLDIEKEGKTLLSISLTIGTIGLVLAPVAALIGIGAALITDYKITITLDNGTKINVNEFAVLHKQKDE